MSAEKHCIHECVCREYRAWYLNAVHVDQPCPDSDTCEHFKSVADIPMVAQQAQTDDVDLEELGNQDIDPVVFTAFAEACDKGAQEQFLREYLTSHIPPEQCPHWWFEQANARWRCKINAGNHEYEAALIAQEREKWERERAQAPATAPAFITCNPTACQIYDACRNMADKDEPFDPFPPCARFRSKEHDAAIAAQAREDVLEYLDELISPSVSDARKHEIIESLRSEVRK